jgi:phosphohistidine phosphatase
MKRMEIYLMRHGEYVDLGSSTIEQDSQNRLSEFGIAQLQRQAKTLAGWQLPVAHIVTSPFVRARQTAEIFAGALHVAVDEHVGLRRTFFNLQVLQEILNQYPQGEPLLLVGHESELSTVAAAVIGGGKLMLERGGIMRILLSSTEPPQGHLLWLLSPAVMGA